MRSISILIIFLFLQLNLNGQELPVKYRLTIDTILLKDVSVTYSIPLNNKQVEKFYRTNYFSTIDNLAEHLDGVSLIKRGAYAMEPQMNGFSGGQLNITIDGMKMFGACTDKMDPVTSYLEPANLESITLGHGTNGNQYGNNIGGSIDLALKEPEKHANRPFWSSLTSGYESVSNSRTVMISTGYTKNKWAWGFNGVYRKNGLYRDGNGQKVNFSQFEKYNLHSVVKFSADTVSVFRADLLWDLALDVGYPALLMDVSRARAGLFSLEYQRNKEKYDLKAKLYYNSVFHKMDDSARDSLFFLTNEVTSKTDSIFMRMDMPGWSNTFGTYIQAVVDLNSKNKLTVKADSYTNASLAEMTMHMHFKGQPSEPPMYLQTWPDMIRNVTGLYISNTTNLNSNLNINVNGRFDFNFDTFQSPVAEQQFSVFNYDLGQRNKKVTKGLNVAAQYRIKKNALFSVQAGISERMPTISERYGFYLFNAYDGYDYIGNPSLKTEKSVFARFMITYFKNDLKINVGQSLNYLSDYILGITDTLIPPMNFYTNGLRVYHNLPGAKMYSTDLQLVYKPGGGFTFFTLTKYTRGHLNSGASLPLIPPLKNIFSISYEKNRWAFQADNETSLRQNRINLDYGETGTRSYTLFNLKASAHFMAKKSMIDCSAGLNNVFDVNYHEHLDWGHIPRPGRSITFFIKYTH
jgi:iron complex outermembrane recepter protein